MEILNRWCDVRGATWTRPSRTTFAHGTKDIGITMPISSPHRGIAPCTAVGAVVLVLAWSAFWPILTLNSWSAVVVGGRATEEGQRQEERQALQGAPCKLRPLLPSSRVWCLHESPVV